MNPGGRGGLAAGFAALRSGKLLVLLLIVPTVVLSLLAAAPLGPSLSDAFADTLAGDHVIENHPAFAPTDVFDFLREKAPAVAGARAAARWAALIIFLQQIFFAGGLVTVLGRAAPITLPDFVAGARRNFWHNVKCFLIFLLLAGIAIGAWLLVTRALSKKVFVNTPPAAWSTFFFRVAVVVGALFLYAVFSLLHDFARAGRRSDPAIGAWRAYVRSRRLLSGRWPRALGLFLFWLVFGGALLLIGIAIEWNAPAVTGLAILLHILIQIAVLSIRPAIRVAAWGSYLALYDSALPPPPVAAVSASTSPPPPEPGPLMSRPLAEQPL